MWTLPKEGKHSRTDWRLQFANLKPKGSGGNVFGEEDSGKIWIPNLMFDNTLTDLQVRHV